MNEKTIKNWLDLAKYDLDTAKAMMNSRRYLYVAFACQQTMEKILKACYIKEFQKTPPYTHNLIKLLESLSIASDVDAEKLEFIEDLNSYYIQSRYSEDIAFLSKSLSKKKSENILIRTKELYLWLKKML